MTVSDLRRIALIGFGEAGSILGQDLVAAGCRVTAYDILLDSPDARQAMLDRISRAGAQAADSNRAAIQDAQLVISAVTAASAADVAAKSAESLTAGQFFLDINSVSPGVKRSNAQIVERTGAHYVESAVMEAVPRNRLKVPMLLGGSRAAELAAALNQLGMNTTAIAPEIGVASAVKMCRSIVIKGIEALTVECVLAARRFGAEDQVLSSLNKTFPGMGWQDKLPDYLVSRVAEHGRRRAAEMREVAKTLSDVGIEPTMAAAIAQRQDWLVNTMAGHGIRYETDKPFSWKALVDAISGAR